MSSFEWMELESLTNDIELSRSRLIEARSRGDRGRARALGVEIEQAEKSRSQLLAHISTNLVTIPEPASKAKDGAGSRQASASAAEALQAEVSGEKPNGDAAKAPEPAPPARARGGAGSRQASVPVTKASPEEVEEKPAAGEVVSAPEPAQSSKASEAAGFRPASAKPDNREGGTTVWDQLKPSDIERVKDELGAQRAEMLARHAEELKELEAEQTQLKTLEQAIQMFLRKANRSVNAAA